MNTPPPPPPPPGFGALPGPYGYQGPHLREHPAGTTVLVLGILGIVVCGVLAPFAWVKGSAARKEIAAQPHVMWTNQGQITAGWICGIVGTCIIAIWIVIVLILVVAAVAST